MKTLEVWDVQFWDGGDRHNHAFYLSLSAAPSLDAIEAKFKYSTAHKQTIIVLEAMDEYGKFTEAKARAKALAKLTQEERILLGLDNPTNNP